MVYWSPSVGGMGFIQRRFQSDWRAGIGTMRCGRGRSRFAKVFKASGRAHTANSFAGLWLSAPTPHKPRGYGGIKERIRVIGWLGYSGELGFGKGYGHFGMSKGGIEAVHIERLSGEGR